MPATPGAKMPAACSEVGMKADYWLIEMSHWKSKANANYWLVKADEWPIKANRLPLTRKKLLKHYEETLSDLGNTEKARNSIQKCFQDLSFQLCKDYWDGWLPEFDRQQIANLEFTFFRSGAGRVSPPQDSVPKEDEIESFMMLEAKRKNPTTKAKSAKEINPKMPPAWFIPQVELLVDEESKIVSLKSVGALRMAAFLWRPFIFDPITKRKPVWKYKLPKEEYDVFKEDQRIRFKKLRQEEKYRYKVFKEKVRCRQDQACRENEDKDRKYYGIEEGIDDVLEFHNACMIKPLPHVTPENLTPRNLVRWVKLFNACAATETDKQAFKKLWEEQRRKYDDIPLFKDLLDSALHALDKYKPPPHCKVL